MPASSSHPDSKSARSAVVLGGGMSGLLASAVLARHVPHVTLVERRRADAVVAQGRHIHVFLRSGARAIERLLDGVGDALRRAGALEGDASADAIWVLGGHRLRRCPSDLTVFAATRPLLDRIVRATVEATTSVTFLRGAATELFLEGEHVSGVRVDGRILDADIVIDATGRASKTPAWLDALGFEVPREERLDVDLTYASATFRDPDPSPLLAVVSGATAACPRGGVAQRVEDGAVMVSVNGFSGHVPPTDPVGFAEYAATLVAPEIGRLVARSEMIDGIHRFKVPATYRRRYDLLERLPAGLLVTGDALCGFNPVYGQGMSVAALEAEALDGCLARGTSELSSRFHRAARRIVEPVWRMTASNDLRIPSVVGPRPLPLRVVQKWIDRVLERAVTDEQVARTFVEVASLVAPPTRLFAPSTVARVLAPKALLRAPHPARGW